MNLLRRLSALESQRKPYNDVADETATAAFAWLIEQAGNRFPDVIERIYAATTRTDRAVAVVDLAEATGCWEG